MAKKLPYFPVRETEQVEWLINFKTKLPGHAGTVGIATGEVTSMTDAIEAYLYTFHWLSTLRSDLQEATAFKNNLAYGTGAASAIPAATVLGTPPPPAAPGVLNRMFALIQRIKNHPSYTTAIGEDLRIIGAENTTTHDEPEFALELEDAAPNQKVNIKFKKFGHEGVDIEMRRPQFGGAWVRLAIDTRTPYTDSTPLTAGGQPETREYRLRFWDEGEANGNYSAVKSVTVR